MNKNESLSFLQNCIERVKNASCDEKRKYKEIYNSICSDIDWESSFEFILPTNECNYEMTNSFDLDANCNSLLLADKKDYEFIFLNVEYMNQESDELAFAA